MSGNVITDHSWSMTPMPADFRFSSRPNQAHLIQWRVWGAAAFTEALYSNKPIFLVISSFWCHYAHLLDETTLSEPSVISIVNADFIPVRVDGDLRPDINQRYHQNGWPSVVMLSSEGEMLWGEVYVAPAKMLYYLAHIRRYYSDHQPEITSQARQLQEQRFTRTLTNALPSVTPSLLQTQTKPLTQIPREAGKVLYDLYDEEHGGFAIHPHLKFPHPDALEVLFHLHEPTADAMIDYSLSQMCEGGLWDEEDGGFFRYSTSDDWSMPQTEKMLEDNAALLRLLLLMVQRTQSDRWRTLCHALIAYVQKTLWQSESGAFSGSQSADEEFYGPGPYSRASRVAPPVDLTIYNAWNARMCSAYLLAAQVLEEPTLRIIALRALDHLSTSLVDEHDCFHYQLPGETARLAGQLVDHVWLAQALLDAYDASHLEGYRQQALALMQHACQTLLDEQQGLFYDYAFDPDAIGRLAVRQQPLIENALAAFCLLRLAHLDQQSDLDILAHRVLSGCLEKYRRTGIQGSTYACVIARAMDCQLL